MLPYPEVNTNFYKQWSVVVPACSSDLFLGSRATRDPATGFYFQGARIATAVIRELQTRRYFEDGVAGPLALADDVVVGGWYLVLGEGETDNQSHMNVALYGWRDRGSLIASQLGMCLSVPLERRTKLYLCTASRDRECRLHAYVFAPFEKHISNLRVCVYWLYGNERLSVARR